MSKGSLQSICGTAHAFFSVNKLLFCPVHIWQAFKHQNKNNKKEFCGDSAPGGGALHVLQANKLCLATVHRTREMNDSVVEGREGKGRRVTGLRNILHRHFDFQ